jgi:hypothetical protein
MQSMLLLERGVSLSYKKTYMWLLSCYLILKPFYYFQSGFPQLADMAIILLVLISLFSLKMETFFRHSSIGWCVAFIYYAAVVNVVWAILLGGQSEIAKQSLFYVYNLAVMIALVQVAYRIGRTSFMQVIFYSVACSVMIQALLIPFSETIGGRSNLMFNNPNQLGYFGLLSLAILIVSVRFITIRPSFLFLSMTAASLLVVVSLSKAAIISALLMLVIFMVMKRENTAFDKSKLYMIIMVGMLLSLFLLNGSALEQNQLVQDALHRIDSIGQSNDDSLAGRGYDRIANHPFYIFLGAGEGIPERFDANIEVHSTLGNILFSYGIVGLAFFGGFIFQAIRKLKFVQYYPLLAVLIYGLAHNGIRHTYLWLLIALLFMHKAAEMKGSILNDEGN